MTWTLCASGSAIFKAGVGASATAIADGTNLALLSDQAEGFISSFVRYDVVANYANLTAQGKTILSALASAIIAEGIIGYDAKGYLMSGEQITALNRMETEIERILPLIDKDRIKTYLKISNT